MEKSYLELTNSDLTKHLKPEAVREMGKMGIYEQAVKCLWFNIILYLLLIR